MTVAPPVAAPTAFELKSAVLALLALVLKNPDPAAVAADLASRTAQAPDLFDQEAVTIDLSQIGDADAVIDFPALIEVLRSHGLRPVAARGGSAAQTGAALAAGLVEDTGAPAPRPAPQPLAEPEVQVAAQAATDDAAEPLPDPAPPDAALPAARTLVIDRPLRSGQQVYARGGDLVVLAAVNFGAEVIADGSIHVYAPLRGRAVAGARGDAGARIFATCMEPQLVSVAGTYRTVETALPPDVHGKPAQVRLDGERLVFEALRS